jgi:hypothetical protein
MSGKQQCVTYEDLAGIAVALQRRAGPLAYPILADASTHIPFWQRAAFPVPVCGIVMHNVALSGSGTALGIARIFSRP